MNPDTLRRLLVMLLAGAYLAAQPYLKKLGLPQLDAAHAYSLAGLVAGYLMQSGLKSALDRASSSKALATVLADGQKALAFFRQLQAAQAQNMAKEGAQNPGQPSQG